ncbi:unnamed protein product [Echinostoma caproni]|uniref:Uncharacterized protein n=1 Tax=Echinostoma caproni TaxID=27848 RepID=A0A183B492_9TREM|nr:unnamed protein product [Echinostoma caproni]
MSVRVPGQLYLSAPADFQSAIVFHPSQIRSTPSLPPSLRHTFEQGICDLKRVQCLLQTFQSWRLSSSVANQAKYTSLCNTDNTVFSTDLQMLSVATAKLITQVIDELADVVLWRFSLSSPSERNALANGVPISANPQSITQSQLTGVSQSSPLVNPAFPAELLHYLTRLSELSLNLAALAACCVDSVGPAMSASSVPLVVTNTSNSA